MSKENQEVSMDEIEEDVKRGKVLVVMPGVILLIVVSIVFLVVPSYAGIEMQFPLFWTAAQRTVFLLYILWIIKSIKYVIKVLGDIFETY